jgi:hypothetical protein
VCVCVCVCVCARARARGRSRLTSHMNVVACSVAHTKLLPVTLCGTNSELRRHFVFTAGCKQGKVLEPDRNLHASHAKIY